MVEELIRTLIESRDVASLDVISTVLHTLNCISKSGYYHCRETIMEVLRPIIDYNLSLKHNLTEDQREEKLKIFDKLYLQGFIDYQHSGELLSKLEIAKDVLQSYAEKRLKELNDLEKKVLSFVLHCKPKFAEDYGRYYNFESFGYKLPQMTLIFNKMFDEILLARNALEIEPDSELPFWELGDVLVKAGIGYWIPYVSSSCHVYLNLIVPKFLFEVLEHNRQLLPDIENFDNRFEDIQKALKDRNVEEEIYALFLAKVRSEEIRIKEYKLPKVREPKCESDLYFLIGRYWEIIRKKTGLEEIVFVDKHWDAEGVYKGKKVRIEVKVDAKDFDKDPTKIDLLICWKVTPSGTILKQMMFDWYNEIYLTREKAYKKSKIWAYDYNISEESKNCLRNLRNSSSESGDLIKEIFRCVGIEVIELSEILKDLS